jgi:RNA polymerase sigma factor for flagellar operon FliA
MEAGLTPAEQQLVAEHGLRVIERVTRFYAAKYNGLIAHDDVKQAALLGVVDAARRFDQSRGRFATFAWIRAVGLIRDAVRAEAQHQRMRRTVSRAGCNVHRQGTVLTDTRESVTTELELHLASAAMAAAVEARLAADAKVAEDQLMLEQSRQKLRHALDSLSRDDWRLIELYYVENKKFQEVAQAFGCSLATARRRHARALEQLLNHLRTFEDADDSTPNA